jgi:membrane carboxypeptidase/penicillin-binding protein
VYVGDSEHGLAAGSQALFGRPLSALSQVELASVVALPVMPSAFRAQPSRLSDRAQKILAGIGTDVSENGSR